MVSIPGLYFVIACDDLARFVRPDPENGLHSVGVVDLARLLKDDTASAEPRGPPGLGHIGFLPLLARRIADDFDADVFTHLVLAGPPDVLQELRGLLDAPTTVGLLGTLARDLMAIPDLELWPHLLPWIQPLEVSWASGVPSLEW